MHRSNLKLSKMWQRRLSRCTTQGTATRRTVGRRSDQTSRPVARKTAGRAVLRCAIALGLAALLVGGVGRHLTLQRAQAAITSQIDIAGPAGSGAFGTVVVVLPNGNIVVTDPAYSEGGVTDIGAVYLYDGATLALISTLKGSTMSDLVGIGGITVLTNGNFVVRSPLWDNPTGSVADVGAVTWCNATTGCNGTVSALNSLIGGTAGDQVGIDGVTALANGNYVVSSGTWDNPAGPVADVGAATWGNGATGTTGPVTAANSLIGSTANDQVGQNGVTALTNGNYVVQSVLWANVGATTWGNGATGTTGTVSAANSLVGSTANDQVGLAFPLTNGNYVVRSPGWDNPSGSIIDVGAVTWGNGAGGTVGTITAANSLIGGTTSDGVGNAGVVALTNGNYVVQSTIWDNPSGPVADVGAVTWGNGTGGTVGLVTSSNSLVGGTAGDQVGLNGVVALTNGNYVVGSSSWDNPTGPVANVGAATWGNGTTGIAGLVTTANSLVGGTAGDQVAGGRIVALTNGNYVVGTPFWDNPTGPVADVGAATWCNGATGTTGPVTAANSLIGGTAGDRVGAILRALTNGNYVVQSTLWDNPSGPVTDVGAVTWCNGATGTTGTVTSSNSLIGGTAIDNVGSTGVTALLNGNYVVRSLFWDNPSGSVADVGAATWGNGATGTIGTVTSSNSLIGGTANDQVSNTSVLALTNGNYAVQSNNWVNPSGSIFKARAVTFGNGATGTTGLVTSTNSVVGTVQNGITSDPATNSPGYSFDATRNRLFVGRARSNIVSVLFFETTAVSDGNFDNAATWSNGVPNALVNATIPAGRTVTVNTASTVGSLTVASGATLTMNANLNVVGQLTLGTQINTGANTLSLSCSSTVTGASASNYIIGNLRKEFCAVTSSFIYPTSGTTGTNGGAATGAFTYPVGTANGYSPVNVTVTAGGLNTNLTSILTVYGLNPASLTVKATEGTAPATPPLNDPTTLNRYWTLTKTGTLTANLVFNYLASDVDGSESSYRITRISGGTATNFPNQCPGSPCVDTTAHTATINGVTSFSDWTLSSGAPTSVCSLTLTPAEHYFNSLGGQGTSLVQTSQGCQWSAISSAPWLGLGSGGSGVGVGALSFWVAPNPDGTRRTATLSLGTQALTIHQAAAFYDVPLSHPFYDYISKLSALGITAGCGDGNYCADAPVTREQMAAFLLRSLGEMNPPAPTQPRFSDVALTSPFAPFIEQMALRGITSGCGGGNYCPQSQVTREQMAAFLIRALHAPGYAPARPAQARFSDVPLSSPFAGYIEELAVRGITSGCGSGNYCPDGQVTRGQMAAFLVRAFGL